VLLMGESGSGKDYLARHIHDHSKRSAGPFYSINCAALPPELAESELFGHEQGAFTGANRMKRGLLELAEGGSILLNEIGELSSPLQAKLLTFLDTISFTRVGGEKSVRVNARIMAATNRELLNEVSAGRFRKDLFYRLNVLTIRVPPLRDRLEDIPTLVRLTVRKLAREMQLSVPPFIDGSIMDALCGYSWPGNVRELRNVIERALILSRGNPLRLEHFVLGESPDQDEQGRIRLSRGKALPEVLGELERAMISEALAEAAGNKQQAARVLGITRHALGRHARKLGITGL
jgi:transcriptional regulator with PAS, ATPase and Fis domain